MAGSGFFGSPNWVVVAMHLYGQIPLPIKMLLDGVPWPLCRCYAWGFVWIEHHGLDSHACGSHLNSSHAELLLSGFRSLIADHHIIVQALLFLLLLALSNTNLFFKGRYGDGAVWLYGFFSLNMSQHSRNHEHSTLESFKHALKWDMAYRIETLEP